MIIKDVVEMKTEMQEFLEETREKSDDDSREFFEDMQECEDKDFMMEWKD